MTRNEFKIPLTFRPASICRRDRSPFAELCNIILALKILEIASIRSYFERDPRQYLDTTLPHQPHESKFH